MLILALVVMIAAQDGPISKFDRMTPNVRTTSDKSLSDIERCLMDVPGRHLPLVYRQPDRPDQAMLIWLAAGESTAAGRIDLERVGSVTRITGWRIGDAHKLCFSTG